MRFDRGGEHVAVVGVLQIGHEPSGGDGPGLEVVHLRCGHDRVADRDGRVEVVFLAGLPEQRDGVVDRLRGQEQALVLASETDFIVNSVNTLGHLVGAGESEAASPEGHPGR